MPRGRQVPPPTPPAPEVQAAQFSMSVFPANLEGNAQASRALPTELLLLLRTGSWVQRALRLPPRATACRGWGVFAPRPSVLCRGHSAAGLGSGSPHWVAPAVVYTWPGT